MIFKEMSAEQFAQFTKTYERRNFWQTTTMSEFRKSNGWRIYYVGVEKQGAWVAATALSAYPLKFGYYAFEATRGLCVDYENKPLLSFFLKEVETFCKKHKGLYFRMDPYYPSVERDIDGHIVEGGFDHRDVVEHLKHLGYKHFGYTVGNDDEFEPRWAFVLDLNGKDETQILNEMSQKTRNQVFATQRKGIHVRTLKLEEMHIFNEMMKHTANRRHFESRDDAFYTRLYKYMQDVMVVKVAQMHVDEYLQHLQNSKIEMDQELASLQAVLKEKPNNRRSLKRVKAIENDYVVNEENIKKANTLQAEYGNVIPMASSFFVTYGKEIFYLYSAAYDKFLKFTPSVALQWDMISYGLKHGYERYNFYGISGNFDKEDEGYGVYQFKRGFNGYVEELLGVFEKPVSWFYPIYHLLKKLIAH
ncbi:MAG: peptidoglycan bridge formation glycyltransferase FemA/FemB family protein [Erysipelotrichia bacterium]|nr:peptidoglycan bridge formation glycyltransferase FemA/FemB family protein [Erysipelotrichia bacterium]NCC54391.1 peptidoglycan bridge formation glycyltransferase FemA/FemB family protein [Erysipelotrichia bacterium]